LILDGETCHALWLLDFGSVVAGQMCIFIGFSGRFVKTWVVCVSSCFVSLCTCLEKA